MPPLPTVPIRFSASYARSNRVVLDGGQDKLIQPAVFPTNFRVLLAKVSPARLIRKLFQFFRYYHTISFRGHDEQSTESTGQKICVAIPTTNPHQWLDTPHQKQSTQVSRSVSAGQTPTETQSTVRCPKGYEMKISSANGTPRDGGGRQPS